MDYLSDHQYLAGKYPGPSSYKADVAKVKPRILATKFNPSQGKKSWRPVKSKEPDCASYEFGKSKDFVSKSPYMHKFAHPKEAGAKFSKETFTT